MIGTLTELNESEYIRFWSKVNLTANPDNCWEWKGEFNNACKFFLRGKTVCANRVAYFSFYKNKIDNAELHRKCENSKCVNPNHLFLGTNNDNVKDKVKKGRQARTPSKMKGKRNDKIRCWLNPGALLNENQHYEILELYNNENLPLCEIGERYGVSRYVIAKAIKGVGGIVNKRTELTEKQVLEIRKKYSKEIGNGGILAKEYNIGRKTILDIVHRITWKHL